MEHAATSYFSSSRDLQSQDPSIRLPAITKLMDLAHHAAAPVRARATAALVREFGPYVMTHGLSGCGAPIQEVEDCFAEPRDCRTCPWFMHQQGDATPETQYGIPMRA